MADQQPPNQLKLIPVSEERARQIKLAANIPVGFLIPAMDFQVAQAARQIKPGKERWPVKTGIDTDVDKIAIETPPGQGMQASFVKTTVEELINLPRPQDMQPPNQGFPAYQEHRSEPVETTIWQVEAEIIALKMENDGDYHLVLQGASGDTMVAEVPNPDPSFVDPGSPFAKGIKEARTQIQTGLLPSIPAANFAGLIGKTFLPDGAFSLPMLEAKPQGMEDMANQPLTEMAFKTKVRKQARITGVGFFDRVHGQTGVAQLNGIELHPVIAVEWLSDE